MRVFLCEKPSQGKDIARVLCAASLRERGLQQGGNFVIDATALEPEDLRRELGNFDVILRF